MVLPTYTNTQIAHYLTDGYWANQPKGIRHHFPVATGGTLTVDMTSISPAGQILAQTAFQAWTMVSGLNFVPTSGATADITMTDTPATSPLGGSAWYPDGTAVDGFVNIPASWLASYGTTLDSYSFMTYMHEIAHALGLGHPGNYDGVATYSASGSGSNHYLNDSWQASIMSYFSPFDNTGIAAHWDYFGTLTGVMTPMIADITAIRSLYGTAGTLRTGDTVYGAGSTAGGYYDSVITTKAAFTLVDDGGVDTINFSNDPTNQTIDLHGGGISSIGGLIGNMVIMDGTVIENYIAGGGRDSIMGNAAANLIKGNYNNDVINGYDGNDILNGNGQNDILRGGNGDDILRGGRGHDLLWGNAGNDVLRGGVGRDQLTGGAGADTFVFKAHWAVDAIRDFENNIDTIKLDSMLWGGVAMTVADLLNPVNGYATVVANPASSGVHVELTFGADKLKVFGITDAQLLLDDITIF